MGGNLAKVRGISKALKAAPNCCLQCPHCFAPLPEKRRDEWGFLYHQCRSCSSSWPHEQAPKKGYDTPQGYPRGGTP